MLKLVTLFALFLNPALPVDQDSRVGRLRDVKTVYVAELGQTENAKTLRLEIIKDLEESKRIKLAQTPDEADAVLRLSVKHGTKNVDWPYQPFGEIGMQIGSKVVPTFQIVLTLNAHQNSTLWLVKFYSSGSADKDEQQAARTLANTVSRKLLKAMESDRKKRN